MLHQLSEARNNLYGNLLARHIGKVLHATAEDVKVVSDYGPELRDGFYERLHRNVEENSQFITVLWVRSRQHLSSVLQ